MMLSTKIGLENGFDMSSRKFKISFDFLKREDLCSLPEGWIELEEGVRVSVQRYTTFDPSEVYFESHEKYYDIQYVIEGSEFCFVTKRDGLEVKSEYEKKNDITFYHDPDSEFSMVYLESGDFIVLSPDDVHKPRVKAGEKQEIKKIVIKVPV